MNKHRMRSCLFIRLAEMPCFYRVDMEIGIILLRNLSIQDKPLISWSACLTICKILIERVD